MRLGTGGLLPTCCTGDRWKEDIGSRRWEPMLPPCCESYSAGTSVLAGTSTTSGARRLQHRLQGCDRGLEQAYVVAERLAEAARLQEA